MTQDIDPLTGLRGVVSADYAPPCEDWRQVPVRILPRIDIYKTARETREWVEMMDALTCEFVPESDRLYHRSRMLLDPNVQLELPYEPHDEQD